MSHDFTRELTVSLPGHVRYAYPPEAGFALLTPYILIPYDAAVRRNPTPPRTGGEFLSPALTYLLNLSMSVANAWYAAIAADGKGEPLFTGAEEAAGQFALIGTVATVITETPFPAGDFTYTREQLRGELDELLKRNGFGEDDLPRMWHVWQTENGLVPFEVSIARAKARTGSGENGATAYSGGFRGRRSSGVFGSTKNGGNHDPRRN